GPDLRRRRLGRTAALAAARRADRRRRRLGGVARVRRPAGPAPGFPGGLGRRRRGPGAGRGAGDGRLAAAAGGDRRALAALPAPLEAEDDQAGSARRAQAARGQSRDQGARAPGGAAAVAAADDGGGAHGRRGGDEPDPLRGGAEVPAGHARAHRGGQGGGRTGAGDPRRGRAAPGDDRRGAAFGTRLVSDGPGRPGNPGETLRRRRAGAVVRLPAAGLGARPRADAGAGRAGRGRRWRAGSSRGRAGRRWAGRRRGRGSVAMSSRTGGAGGILSPMRAGVAAPVVVLALLAMVIVPLSPLVLDVLFTVNIALSLVVMLAVVYVRRPLEFSIFPSVLLLVTLLRLALNVASTRVVLLRGHEGPAAAGHVIESFAEFVIGGSYAVGIVVFAILTIVNFIVVTKGAGRISEVSARFILDALPGKQMAIDADLNAGLLTREDAKARRQEV